MKISIDKVILKHRSYSGGDAFDFLCKPELVESAVQELGNIPYRVDCSVVKGFQSENGNRYVYLGSEDLCHIDAVNSSLRIFIDELIGKGWVVVEVKR